MMLSHKSKSMPLPVMMKKWRIANQMFIKKIRNLLHKKIPRKTNLILIGNFNWTIGNKDKSTSEKQTCNSQEEMQGLMYEFDLEDLLEMPES